MAQAFLDKDTLHYCLYVMGLRQSEISRNLEDICKMIVLSKYNGEYDAGDGEPSELTDTELLDIINPEAGG